MEGERVTGNSLADIPKAILPAIYTTMVKIRKFEERVTELVSQKEIV
jgi:TPP-dependent pyruvate/acetoin dehydrogenase alpha subunit